MCEYLGILHLIGKELMLHNKLTVIQEHLCCNYSSLFEDFPVLTTERTTLNLKTQGHISQKRCIKKYCL